MLSNHTKVYRQGKGKYRLEIYHRGKLYHVPEPDQGTFSLTELQQIRDTIHEFLADTPDTPAIDTPETAKPKKPTKKPKRAAGTGPSRFKTI